MKNKLIEEEMELKFEDYNEIFFEDAEIVETLDVRNKDRDINLNVDGFEAVVFPSNEDISVLNKDSKEEEEIINKCLSEIQTVYNGLVIVRDRPKYSVDAINLVEKLKIMIK